MYIFAENILSQPNNEYHSLILNNRDVPYIAQIKWSINFGNLGGTTDNIRPLV